MSPDEHIAFTGKAGSPIWVGRKRFELEGSVKILFTPEELIEGDKIVIAHAEAWLLRGDVLHRARLYNMPVVHFSAGGSLLDRQEVNLLYVAVTRASHGLQLNETTVEFLKAMSSTGHR